MLMIRAVLTLILALAVAAEASAQNAPATKAAAHRTAPKQAVVRNTTARPAPAETGGRTKIGPGGNGAVGSTESADGKGQGVYAAPGMSVKVDNPKNVGGYNGPAPTRPKSSTTLTPR